MVNATELKMNVGDFMLQKGFRYVKVIALDQDEIKLEDMNGNTTVSELKKAGLEPLTATRLTHLEDTRIATENRLGFLNEMISHLKLKAGINLSES